MMTDFRIGQGAKNRIRIYTRKKSAESTAEFLKLINKIIGTYASKHSISFVFPKKNILIAKSEFDITDKIIVLVNQNIDKIAIK